MPETVTNSWNLITSSFKTAIGGYFRAQFKIMLIIAVIIFAGLEIAGVKYAVLIALFIAFLDFLPFFGTGAVFWPWALIDMISANYVRAIILMVIYLICQIVKQILQPKMVGDSIGISPLATLIYMFIGYRFYGVLGMIIGIPIGLIINNLYRIGMFDRIIRGLKIIAHDINEFRKY
jgi:sporulation integral membrane protein YtvI